MPHRARGIFFFFLLSSLCTGAGAADWPQWRGPHADGATDAAGLPEKLDSDHPLWMVQLPGPGSGTPVVAADRVLLSCVDKESGKLLAMCVGRKDGKLLWKKEITLATAENERNNLAAPSAITDGQMAWFYFGTGDLAAFTLDGTAVWSRNISKDYGPFHIQWLYGSSPLLYGGKLFVQVLQRDLPTNGAPAESYLLAIDPKTGKDIYRHVRPNDAREESKESYATPTPLEIGGKSEIILIGGDCVTAHDPENGNELWRAGGWNPNKINHWRVITSVETGGGLVFACAPKGGPLMAIRPDGSGDVTDSRIVWKTRKVSSDVCVPLYYKDKLYVLDGDKKALSRLDPATGAVEWTGDLGGHAVFRASPTAAEGKIYCMNETGDVTVVAAADSFNILDKAGLGGKPDRASVVLVDGMVIIRAGDKLFAFSKS